MSCPARLTVKPSAAATPRQGWTKDQLVEVLLHLSGYVGVPIIRESLLVAKKVFADMPDAK